MDAFLTRLGLNHIYTVALPLWLWIILAFGILWIIGFWVKEADKQGVQRERSKARESTSEDEKVYRLGVDNALTRENAKGGKQLKVVSYQPLTLEEICKR